MNKEQQEVLSLLKEIDIICRKHQIPYYLSPRLTLRAVTGNPLPLNPLAGIVVMKLPDMERFRKIMETELPKGRVLESMKNNGRFPGFFLRYENKNTLCFRLYEGRNYQYPGIGVDILPLRALKSPKKVRAWDRRLETGWVQTCDKGSSETDLYKFVCGCWVRLLSIAGRIRLGGKIYDRLCKNQDTKDAKNYVLQWNRNTAYTYSADIFRETQEMELEGERFLVPGKARPYLRSTFGQQYENRVSEADSFIPSLMVSTLVSCEDFLREAGPLKKLCKGRRRQFLADNYVKRYKEYFDWCWEYAKSCAGRRELGAFYIEKKEYIRNLWKDRDLARLETVFRPYRQITKRFLDAEEVFAPDEEILDIYLKYQREIGNIDFAEKIEKYRK